MRFLNGTPSVPCLYAAQEGLRIIAAVGVARIREHSRRLTQRLYERARALGFPTLTPEDPERRGGTVCVSPPGAQAISRELLARDLLIDYRPDAGIRISPHFYSTEDECDAVLDEIATLARGSAKPHPAALGSWTSPGPSARASGPGPVTVRSATGSAERWPRAPRATWAS
jgi:kynureninase